MWILGVLAVSACNLMASGKSSFGGKSSSGSTPTSSSSSSSGSTSKDSDSEEASAPEGVAANEDEKILADEGVARHDLKTLDTAAKNRDYRTYALHSMRMHSRLLRGGGWKDPKKDAYIARRLEQLDKAVYKPFARLTDTVGDAKRVLEADEDAVAAAKEMVNACQTAATSNRIGAGVQKELAKKIAAYEKLMARVTKLDPKAFRFMDNDDDIASDLLACEGSLAETMGDTEDEYVPEVVNQVENEKDCGAVDFLIDGVQIGGGNFAPYTRTSGGRQGLEKMPCNKLGKKNKYPKGMASAVKEFAEDIGMKLSDLVIVVSGASYVEGDDDDGRLHRYQKLTAYSKKFEFSGNPCGNGKLFCEAGGSRGATAFNRLEHAFDRAAVHAGKAPDRCKTFLKKATQEAEGFAKFREDALKSKSWISGATYKTKKGAKLKEKDFVAAFVQKGEQAQEMLDNKYCAKPATK